MRQKKRFAVSSLFILFSLFVDKKECMELMELADKQHCCEQMTKQLNSKCSEHPDAFDCADNVIYYSPNFDEYGLIIHDGGSSYIAIKHCPWCGVSLPKSKRDLWFDKLVALGYDNPWTQDIPKEFLSNEWFEKK